MSTPTEHTESFVTDATLRWGRLKGRLFLGLCIGASLFGVTMLVFLLADVLYESYVGIVQHEIDVLFFLTETASRRPQNAGFLGAIVASVWLMILTTILAFFVGVGSAMYLEEYASDNRLTRLIEANLTNLAGVPSIVYGLLVLAMFVHGVRIGPIIVAGAIALALLVMPIIIVASQEALRAVPDGLRNGSYATGATKWQTIRRVVLPAAMPGILTGTILALARAIGETAPLIMVGALVSSRRIPHTPLERFSAMPSQIYSWADDPQLMFLSLAALGIAVLLAIMFLMNATAVYLRHKFEKDLQ